MSFRTINNNYIEQSKQKMEEEREIRRKNILNLNRNKVDITNTLEAIKGLIRYIYEDKPPINNNNFHIFDDNFKDFIDNCYKYYFRKYAEIDVDFDSPAYAIVGLEIAILVSPDIRDLYWKMICDEKYILKINEIINTNISSELMNEIIYTIIDYYRQKYNFDDEYECANACFKKCIEICNRNI